MTEEQRISLCEAADILRTFGLDGAKRINKEALRLCVELQLFIALLETVEPTWESA